MQSEGFHYYFFDPIEFDAFVSYFQPRGEFESLAKARERFDDWQRGYYRKVIAFYSSQYERHERIVRMSFVAYIKNQVP